MTQHHLDLKTVKLRHYEFKFVVVAIFLPIARKKRTSSLAKSHFSSSRAVSNKIVANCLLTDDGSRFYVRVNGVIN